MLSSASGFKSSTLRSTARMAHRELGAASSSSLSAEPGSARSSEKASFTWGGTGASGDESRTAEEQNKAVDVEVFWSSTEMDKTKLKGLGIRAWVRAAAML